MFALIIHNLPEKYKSITFRESSRTVYFMWYLGSCLAVQLKHSFSRSISRPSKKELDGILTFPSSTGQSQNLLFLCQGWAYRPTVANNRYWLVQCRMNRVHYWISNVPQVTQPATLRTCLSGPNKKRRHFKLSWLRRNLGYFAFQGLTLCSQSTRRSITERRPRHLYCKTHIGKETLLLLTHMCLYTLSFYPESSYCSRWFLWTKIDMW